MLTKYAIEEMGFTEHSDTDELTISFGIIKMYSLRGFVFDNSYEVNRLKIASFGSNCNAVIALSPNEACQLLTNDEFTENEEKWLSDNKASPPFLLIYFWESQSRTLRGGYRKEEDGNIYTHDAFPEGKQEIRHWESDTELRIITALTVHLSTLDRQVEIIPVARSVLGKTTDGRTLFDLKATSNVTGYASTYKSIDSIANSMDQAVQLFDELTKDSSHHFYAAINEKDRLKKFLGFFMFLERLTHRTFKSLSYENNAKQLFVAEKRIQESATELFSKFFSESKNLAQRFHWCALCVWQQLEDLDVDFFFELKKVRDRLAHGEHIEESELPVEKAKTLCLKLLGTKDV